MAIRNIQVTSDEIILPSSPTPPPLRNLKLSLLDQISPSNYTPIIFFYAAVEDLGADRFSGSRQLKKSLSEILTLFYPFAGTLSTEGYSVDCNDKGVEYSEARVDCKLLEVVESPDFKVLHRLLPFEPYANLAEPEIGRDVILAVRLNLFDCGGVAIALCVTHKLVDGLSATVFVREWAAINRGDSDQVSEPLFDGAKYFPPKEIPGLKRSKVILNDKIVTKRFVFDKANIAALRREAAAGSLEKPPTRVEAVSAFLWKRFMEINRNSEQENEKIYAAIHAVNLRGKMDPPLPPNSSGNLWWFAIAVAEVEMKKRHQYLVKQIRNAIEEIDSDLVRNLQQAGVPPHMWSKTGKHGHPAAGEVEFCNFTSWCRFPVYEADFGWGKPTWVCSPSRPFKNVVVLMTTRDGDGIEAWVTLNEQDMASFQQDSELVTYTYT
ncbi:vinorine synthase-like [Momordica charantia]|uniref:Vinorine synthase-like n=1 Tax=Momordica charantia TaxID=3673 RepID=A0A6J1C4D5_MOMCH|nr:vinorine synthase-like [Momordica charantia]